MDKDTYASQIAETKSFDELMELVKKETKSFVKNLDQKTYGQSFEFLNDVIFTVEDVVRSGKLTWTYVVTGQDLVRNVDEKESKRMPVKDIELTGLAREEFAKVMAEECNKEYTVKNELSARQHRNLEFNFRNLLIQVVTDFFYLSEQKERFDENKSKQMTENFWN